MDISLISKEKSLLLSLDGGANIEIFLILIAVALSCFWCPLFFLFFFFSVTFLPRSSCRFFFLGGTANKTSVHLSLLCSFVFLNFREEKMRARLTFLSQFLSLSWVADKGKENAMKIVPKRHLLILHSDEWNNLSPFLLPVLVFFKAWMTILQSHKFLKGTRKPFLVWGLFRISLYLILTIFYLVFHHWSGFI